MRHLCDHCWEGVDFNQARKLLLSFQIGKEVQLSWLVARKSGSLRSPASCIGLTSWGDLSRDILPSQQNASSSGPSGSTVASVNCVSLKEEESTVRPGAQHKRFIISASSGIGVGSLSASSSWVAQTNYHSKLLWDLLEPNLSSDRDGEWRALWSFKCCFISSAKWKNVIHDNNLPPFTPSSTFPYSFLIHQLWEREILLVPQISSALAWNLCRHLLRVSGYVCNNLLIVCLRLVCI